MKFTQVYIYLYMLSKTRLVFEMLRKENNSTWDARIWWSLDRHRRTIESDLDRVAPSFEPWSRSSRAPLQIHYPGAYVHQVSAAIYIWRCLLRGVINSWDPLCYFHHVFKVVESFHVDDNKKITWKVGEARKTCENVIWDQRCCFFIVFLLHLQNQWLYIDKEFVSWPMSCHTILPYHII